MTIEKECVIKGKSKSRLTFRYLEKENGYSITMQDNYDWGGMTAIGDRNAGGCCGLLHLQNFHHDAMDFFARHPDLFTEMLEFLSYASKKRKEEYIWHYSIVRVEMVGHYLIVANLTDSQLKSNKQFNKLFLKSGFRPVTRWRNPNSRNYVTHFVRHPSEEKLPNIRTQ